MPPFLHILNLLRTNSLQYLFAGNLKVPGSSLLGQVVEAGSTLWLMAIEPCQDRSWNARPASYLPHDVGIEIIGRA